MKKLSTRFFLAAGLYVFGAGAALVGLLLNYAIPRGGGGRAAWLALSRHDWADIHAFLALCFLACAVAHAVVNRAQVMAHVKKIVPDTAPRPAVLAVAASPLALVILAWLFTLVF